MKKHFKFFALAVTHLLFFTASVKGQNTTAVDSLSFYLNDIKSSADTNNIKQVYEWLYKSKEEILLKNDVINKIEQLKNKIDDRNYYDLVESYFSSLVNNNTTASNEKAIAVGMQWVANNENTKSKYGHYTFLTVLRELRKPLRNTGKLNESVEYYAAAEKRYLSTHDSDAVSIANNVLSGTYFRLGLIEKAKYYQLKSISYLNDSQKDYSIHPNTILLGKTGKVNRYAVLGSYYITENKQAIAEDFLNEAIRIYHELDSPLLMADAPFLFLQKARCKTLEKNDSSLFYYDTALKYFSMYGTSPLEYANFYQEKGVDFISKKQLDSARLYIGKARQLKDSFNLGITSYFGELIPDYHSAAIYLLEGRPKEAIALLQKENSQLKQLNLRTILINNMGLLAKAYAAAGEHALAYKTLDEAFALKEKLVNEANEARSMNFDAEKKMQEKENAILLLDAQNKSNQKTKYYLFGIVGLLALFVMGLAVFYSNKRKTNRELALKNERLAYTIQQLKATQTQLIQSEKMASLGELTAGIAHEIQNPLNFVNNFSEVNSELIKELKTEIANGNTEEVNALADDIESNSEKINHHGKRADAIVKGMLQHSRTSSGQKELTDINALCDEYLRLSYHGLRAKDKTFNAKFETDLDNSIAKINIMPQDMGRVILNLINNAFYAVNEKKKTAGQGYEPIVSVSTKKENDKVLISIADNGNGIPSKIIAKIFQPFFTTKPTGQGTGLGLSLSYDIVKAHSGELKVETKEGEGTIFFISLPAV